MKVSRYVRKKHYPILKAWYEGHGEVAPPPTSLPKTGFLIPGICCMFVVKTDTDWAILEGMISNPKAEQEERRRALDLICDASVKAAKKMGYTYLTFTSDLAPVIGWGVKYGFKANPEKYTQMIKVL